MTILALLRHGDTDWSTQKRIQGRTDTSLSENGRAALGRRLVPDAYRRLRVISSPLRRCVETAEMLGLEIERHEERLVEMRWGEWEGRHLSDLRAELGGRMRENEDRGLDFRPPGGESPREVLARAASWMAEAGAQGRASLAITHRGVIRAIFALAAGWDMRGRCPVRFDWSALHVFTLDATGNPRISRLNVPLEEALRVPAQGRAAT